MKPERDNIAAPELPGRITWLNADAAPRMSELTAAGPVLVAFVDPMQLNSARIAPYLNEWQRRYERAGLRILGINSPRFAFSGERQVVEEGIAGLEIEFEVAIDDDYAIWHDYGCQGWPSLFVWGQGGALRWFHFGEGEYAGTEEAIQDELRSMDVTAALPPPVEPIRGTDHPGVLLPVPSPERFPGGSSAEPWIPSPGSETIEFGYEAGGVWLVADGEGSVRLGIDDERAVELPISKPGLVPLIRHDRHGSHHLTLGVPDGVRVWGISFEPGTG